MSKAGVGVEVMGRGYLGVLLEQGVQEVYRVVGDRLRHREM